MTKPNGISVDVRLDYRIPEDSIHFIHQELDRALSGFIGERNNENARQNIKQQVQKVIHQYKVIDSDPGILTPELLEKAATRAVENFGQPNQYFHYVPDEKDIENNKLRQRIKELEDQVEYYKMLSMEN